MLTFDEAEHRYFWCGQRVPNVTGVLAPLIDLSAVPADVLERTRQEGIAIHRMIELDVRGTLDVAALPEWLHPRYAAWQRFVREAQFVPIASEQRVYHRLFRYAGTLDLRGTIDMRKAIIDVKRSLHAGPVIGLQLSGYVHAHCYSADERFEDYERYALTLGDDEKYRLEPFTDPTDFQTFLALLTIHRWGEAKRRSMKWTPST